MSEKYSVDVGKYILYFSTEKQKDKFIREYERYRYKLTGQLMNWYNLQIDMLDYADMALYVKIESNIHVKIKPSGEVIEQWQDLRFVGKLVTSES